jgi:pantothenate kinase
LERLGRRDRKGAPDTFDVDGYGALLGRLRDQGEPVVYAPVFDRGLEEPIGSAVAVPRETPLVITEGNYLLLQEGGWQRVRPLLDEVWFLETVEAVRRRRLIGRRRSFGEDETPARRWVDDVDADNATIVEACRGRADLVLSVADLPPMPDRAGVH